MNPLSGFSDWTLALLPRLLLYPAGLTLLLALFFVWTFNGKSGGKSWRAGLREICAALANANIPTIATAWAAVALLPLTFTSPLPFPADRFALAGLLVVSLCLDVAASNNLGRGLWAELAVVVALMSPLAQARGMLPANSTASISQLLAGLAAVAGLTVMGGNVSHSLSRAVRWLAWWGLTLAAIWLPGIGLGLPLLSFLLLGAQAVSKRDWERPATVLAYALGAAALLTPLLLPQA